MERNGKVNGNSHNVAKFAGIESFALPQTNAGLNLPNGNKGVQQHDRLQENLVADIADAFVLLVKPLGSAVTAVGKQDCVAAREVRCPESSMTTVALRGLFAESENYAQGFYRAVGQSRECVRRGHHSQVFKLSFDTFRSRSWWKSSMHAAINVRNLTLAPSCLVQGSASKRCRDIGYWPGPANAYCGPADWLSRGE